MYKVMIVDDEILIRKRIRLGFDWEALGYQVLGDVGSGQEALRLLREEEYDLAIVDIAMPGINGIELVKRLREEKNDIQVIFLTGHSDFSYARQAITYGVYGYILKPVNEEEFNETLSKLKKKLDEDREEQQFLTHIAMKQGNAELLMESKFFSEIFHNGIRGQDVEDIRRRMRDAGMDPDEEYVLSIFQIGKYVREEISLLERCQTLYQAGRDVFRKNETVTVICDIFDNTCILFKKWMEGDSDGMVLEKLESLRRFLEETLDTHVRCGISTCKRGVEQLVIGYREAAGALQNTKYYQASAGKQTPIVLRACAFMEENCHHAELTQGGIAEAMGVTPAYLSGIFKKAMGVSMTQYLSTVRLERAKELLEETDLEVREVAESVGYSDEYYFSRCFKKYHGYSPSQMKKSRN